MKFTKVIIITAIILMANIQLFAQQKITRTEYIQKYKQLAIESQEVYGIPASIKLAQGILESESGNSRLAVEANNHFGIKCRNDWKGQTITHDDDRTGECFRKYKSSEESYRDHSEFLDKSPRYQELFKLEPTDYKGWAYGLKAAGYATSPTYSERLIKIIEDNQLHQIDLGTQLAVLNSDEYAMPEPGSRQGTIDVDNYNISVQNMHGYTLYTNNGSEFIIANQGDTFEYISNQFNIPSQNLRKYNDLPSDTQLFAGDMVYLKRKASRANNGKLIHIAQQGETMHGIAQKYGIKLSNLCSINRRGADSEVQAGQQIRLM